MKQRLDTQPDPELLFIAGSSRDRRGKRVLVRDDSGCENWIWADDGGVDKIDKLLGITPDSKLDIERFFAGIGQPGGAVDN